ncbi:MAG: ROK family transcriptional regulator [Lachnospiraceae bacterium]|nr:ROK family transcriptional regulator [Lachnospiraceae bacterium]
MVTGSKELMREMNLKSVIRTIMDDGPISRADISKKLGLTKATISSLVLDLLQQNLVREIGTAEVTSGRKPVLLEFCFNCGYGITVDISGTKITILSATLGGAHCQVKQYPTANVRDQLVPELINAIEKQIALIPECPYGLIGITLGIHGIVDHGSITFTPYCDYGNLDIATPLKERFQVPVYVENEANLSVLGEYTFHYPGKNVVGLSVHSGIGLGIIVKQKLFGGTHGFAGEFGHSIIQVDGRPCPCGNRGCLEQYASEKVLLTELAQLKQVPHLSADEFAVLYQRKDPDAIEIMNRFIKYIAIGINNILNTLDPDLIIINSSFTMNFPQIIPEIKAAITGRNHDICNLLPSELQDMSILLGGICYTRNKFLES